MKITTFDPGKHKTVLCGILDEETFTREVKAVHFMKVMQGYGIQENAFQEILEKGCTRIIIKTKTDEYFAPIDLWIEKGKVADYSSGKQRFLSLKFMKIRKVNYVPIEGTNSVKVVENFIDQPE